MPDDQNLTQNPISEENSIPPSPQEPTADAPIPPMDSAPAEVPSKAPEASGDGFSAESNNILPSDSTPAEAENKPENQTQNEPKSEPVSEPIQTLESVTIYIKVNRQQHKNYSSLLTLFLPTYIFT